MEMIDVLTKLKEIAESKPELVKDAVENVEKTNPKAVTEGGMKDYLHDEAEKLSREEFLKKHGESLAGFYDAINGTEEAVEGAPLIEKDPVLVEINKKIAEAFDIFDHESNKTVDVRYSSYNYTCNYILQDILEIIFIKS